MPNITVSPLRPLHLPEKYTRKTAGWIGGELCVEVCQFQFRFSDVTTIEVYLDWFNHYAKRHRRQTEIINNYPALRNRICKLPAHLFKKQNREKVIKALRQALQIARIKWASQVRPLGRTRRGDLLW